MGEAPDDEPDDSPRRLTRRRIIVLAVVGSLVVVGVAVGVAVWQLRDDPPPPTLTEQVAAVPGISEETAAAVVDNVQSDPTYMAGLLDACAEGTSVRGFGGAAMSTSTRVLEPEVRAATTAAFEIIYKYYCPQAASS